MTASKDQRVNSAAEQLFFLSSRDLIGTEVVDRDSSGHTLGRVASIIIDQTTGRAVYLILEWGGFLGWDKNRILVPFDIVSFSGRWDRPTLRVPASKVENAPQFHERDLDDVLRDPEWRRAVAQYFGMSAPESDPNVSGKVPVPRSSNEQARPPRSEEDDLLRKEFQVSSEPAGLSSPTTADFIPKAEPGQGSIAPTSGSGSAAASGATTALAPAVGVGDDPDSQHGQAVAQRSCAACHTFNQGGATRVGPNLFGIAQRPVASVPGYNYSPALKGRQGGWDAAGLNAFLKNPRGYVPGTYMTFPGISSDRDRQDVVAYLEGLKAGVPK